MPKTLITNSDRDTSTYNPNRPSYFKIQTEDNLNKRNPRALRKSTKCGHQGIQTNTTLSIKKSNWQTWITQRQGQANPILKKPYFQACTRLCIRETRVLYVTVQERNLRMQAFVHNCVWKKPAYRYKLFSKRRKIHKAFKHYGKHEPR